MEREDLRDLGSAAEGGTQGAGRAVERGTREVCGALRAVEGERACTEESDASVD